MQRIERERASSNFTLSCKTPSIMKPGVKLGRSRVKEDRKVRPVETETRTEEEEDASNEIQCNCLQTDDHPDWTYEERMPTEKWPNIRNRYDSSFLMTDEEYLSNPSMKKFLMAMGWTRGGGFDASVAFLDGHLKLLDIVWYVQLQSKCGSIECIAKEARAVDSADNFVISVDLAKVPATVHHLLFCVSNYNHSFVANDGISGCIRMINVEEKQNGCEMFKFAVQDMSTQSTVMGVLTRKGPLWSFKALGRPATGCTIEHLLENEANLKCLADCQSWEAEQRKITVKVVRGKGLAAKDKPTLLNEATSDPYCIIKFKDKSYKSEYVPKTLEPEWKSAAFELGWITEAETAPLKIQIFDYDCISRDDFMGERWIPACALYDLGPGHHTYWYLLNHIKEGPYAKEDVSGKILIHIVVEEVKNKANELNASIPQDNDKQ